MRIDLCSLRETIFNIIDILISPLRKLKIKLKGNKMIHVNYDKKDNYPHHKKIILFDRDAFQSLGDKALLKVNKKYNVLCPQVFVIECLAPNRATEEQRRWLFRRLKLIENPIVLTGKANVSPVIDIPPRSEYHSILVSEQIARNCIISNPITMERVDPEELISHYKPRINAFKKEMKAYTETCEVHRGTLSPNRYISNVQEVLQDTQVRVPSIEELRQEMRENERTRITQELSYAAREAQYEMESRSVNQNVEGFETFFFLTNGDTRKLRDQIQNGTILTTENYPDLSYPIYIYYFGFFIVCCVQHETQHLDQSYMRDLRYLHYLNFCDRFITNERSTPHIVNSFPYDDIKNIPISTVAELKMELS